MRRLLFAVLLCAWSQPGRLRNEAAFARLAGAEAMNRSTDGRVVPVEIRQPPASAMDEIRDYVMPALEPIETIFIVSSRFAYALGTPPASAYVTVTRWRSRARRSRSGTAASRWGSSPSRGG